MLSVECESEDEEYKYVAEIEVKEQVHPLASSGHPNKVFATLAICQWKGGEVPAGQWIEGKHHER